MRREKKKKWVSLLAQGDRERREWKEERGLAFRRSQREDRLKIRINGKALEAGKTEAMGPEGIPHWNQPASSSPRAAIETPNTRVSLRTECLIYRCLRNAGLNLHQLLKLSQGDSAKPRWTGLKGVKCVIFPEQHLFGSKKIISWTDFWSTEEETSAAAPEPEGL